MAIAVSKNQFIAKVSTSGDYVGNSQEEMKELMNNLNANNTNPDIQAHFDDSKDITMAFNYRELFKMYETYMPPDYYPQIDIQYSEWINIRMQ